ncbi:MAG: hypothetical protein ACO25B_13040 [Chitinophagaceae bacterium]
MSTPKKPVTAPEVPYPGKRPEIDPDQIPELPEVPEEDPEIIPDEDPFENPPDEIPPPGEKP